MTQNSEMDNNLSAHLAWDNYKKPLRRIVIESFGALKKVDICLDKQLLTIIGPQASGKSTLGKVVYFCRKIRDYLSDYARVLWEDEAGTEPFLNFLKYLQIPFVGCFGTTKHMEQFKIRYYYDVNSEKYVQIKLDNKHYARFVFSKTMKEEIGGLIKEASEASKASKLLSSGFEEAVISQSSFRTQFKLRVHEIFMDDEALLFIPAGRNLLATIPDLIMPSTGIRDDLAQYVDISQTDLITQDFVHYIQRMRKRFGLRLEEMTENYLKTVRGQIRNHDVELARNLIKGILKADYVYDKEGEKLYYSDGRWVKLMFGSSGQQEVLWALNCIFLSILQNEKTFMIFEEPEAHIFPDAQELLSRLTALMINSTGSSVMLTTHSPYILTTVNLLIFSGQVEKEGNGSVVEKRCRLRSGAVAAYMIPEGNGELMDIVDKESGLIDALAIDQISDSINERMDDLLIRQIGQEKEEGH